MTHYTRRRFLQHVALGSSALAAQLALGPFRAIAGDEQGPFADQPLAPGVFDFIADTYLSHAADFPDPNEPVEVLQLYLEGNDLHWNGDHDGARALFQQAVAAYPDSRHAHAGLGCALMHQYEQTGVHADLQHAMQRLSRAATLGMDHGRVRYTDLLASGLPALHQAGAFGRLFQRALALGDRPYLTTLHYAEGLSRFGDARAEAHYRAALRLEPEGDFDARASYAQWLIDAGRYADALATLAPRAHADYLDFLRGVAYERLGQLDQARASYAAYREFNQIFAAPARYRIPGSPAQDGLHFDNDIAVQSHCQGHIDLSTVIYCESGGESVGGQRAVGWTVRTRVFHGTIYCCISINNSGSSLCAKYYNVIHQPSQFYLGCGRRSATSNQVAYDVWYGRVPDPLTGYCPCGSRSGTLCSGSCSCTSENGAHGAGPIWFYGTSGACPSFTCRHNHGKICGNGGSDNCFYNNHCPNGNCC